MRRAAALVLAAAAAAAVACVPARRTPEDSPSRAVGRGPAIRVALATLPHTQAPSEFAPGPDGTVAFRGRRYRGALRTVTTDSGALVINVLPLEHYLLGVVPLELGERPTEERAALEAQAIAARSFAVTRLGAARAGRGRSPHFDLLATVADQVYGGVDAERPNASAAVRATAGLVLKFGDRVVGTPYHSSCGGETAAASEVWGGEGEPFLQRVSDRVPGRDRYYCDIAPRFAWERPLGGEDLNAAVERYLRAYAAVPRDGPGPVRGLRIVSRSQSGRANVVEFRTARGTYTVRGNDARSVLRSAGGELLPSSYFSVSVDSSSSGALTRVLLRGNGYGHGVGLCQWGAIGRARAGQSARTILQTYFPGTTLGSIPASLLAQ